MEWIEISCYIHVVEYYTTATCTNMDKIQKYNTDWSKMIYKKTPKLW